MATLMRDVDFYHLDEWLSPEEKMTRDAVRRFVEREVLPAIEHHFANETFPTELAPMMAELGIFGANLKGTDAPGWTTLRMA
jgi:glutaryl-CoA dehydrogenase